MAFCRPFLCILTACLLCTATADGLSLHLLTSPVATALLLSWPTVLLRGGCRVAVQLLVGEAVVLLCCVDAYCQELFGSAITPQLLNSVLLTTARESSEFLSVFGGAGVLAHPRLAALVLLAVAYPLTFLPPAGRWLSRRAAGPAVWGRAGRWTGVALLAACAACELPPAVRYCQLFTQQSDLERVEGLIFRHYHEAVPTPLHRLAFACYAQHLSARQLAAIRQATCGAAIDSCRAAQPHIVLLIGESYNKHHSQLYGYPLPTTPRQQARCRAGELVVFTDVVTPWNITSNVFLNLFSLWEAGDSEPVSRLPLFPVLFRRAGYEVTFFSNQYLLGGFLRGSTSQAGHFFLADSELSDTLFDYRNTHARKYDMGLVHQLASYRAAHAGSRRTLDIVHLYGQHFDYVSRYPADMAFFTEKDYAGRNLDEEARRVVMHYDNATRYNDLVADSLLALYEDDDAVVVCVSDHGEEVYDELPRHGRLFQQPTAPQVRQEFEVPMWVWCSPRCRQQHPQLVERIRQAAARPFMTDGMPQLLLSLAGISTRWNRGQRNLLSPAYRPKQRIVAGVADYDALLRQASAE